MKNSTPSARACILIAAVVAHVVGAPTDSQAQDKLAEDLSVQQAVISDRFERLEMVAARLAELSAGTDPRRARRLREALAKGRDQDINIRFEETVKLLESERLTAALDNQQELRAQLSGLLELLLKDSRQNEIESERRRMRRYLKEIGRLIRWQQSIRLKTADGDDFQLLEAQQAQATEHTGELAKEISDNEAASQDSSDSQPGRPGEESTDESSQQSGNSEGGTQTDPSEDSESGDNGSSEPGEQSQSNEGSQSGGSSSQQGGQSQEGDDSGSESPTDRVLKNVQAAQQRMQQAMQKLEEAERAGATEEQQAAERELEKARAELERVLRQMREEELERTLTLLAARFRKMLAIEVNIYEATLLLDETPEELRGHEAEIEAARIGRKQSLNAREAEKALILLREEGSSVAFPETVELIEADMRQVAKLLVDMKVGALTQNIEQDIIEALEESISALEKALKDLESQQKPPGPMQPGDPSDQPLVDKIAELKMIRSLQLRVNRRTHRYGDIVPKNEQDADDIREALWDLSERQKRIQKATKDLAVGRND